MQDRTLLIILFTTLTLLLGSLATYQYISFENIRETQAAQYRSFQQSLQEFQQRITTEVATVNGSLTTRIEGGLTQVESAVNKTRQANEQSISHLTGQLGKIEQESDQKIATLEDQLHNVRLSNKDFSAIISDIIKSVVSVKTDKGIGSGAIVNGNIITNKHVIEGATKAVIVTHDGQNHPVKLIGMHNTIDLAVIGFGDNANYPSLNLETKESRMEAGAKVIAVGNPGGLEFSVTEGIISAKRQLEGIDYIQHDVPINPGNSGGPLINIHGNIVGINTKKREGFESVGFAIHADMAQQVIQQITEAAQS